MSPNSLVRFVMLLALVVASAASASTVCDVCNLRLTSRTGPYKIVASDVLRVGGSDRPRSVAPRKSISFDVTHGYRLGRPGVYRFNVSYDGVDSNILTYAVR